MWLPPHPIDDHGYWAAEQIGPQRTSRRTEGERKQTLSYFRQDPSRRGRNDGQTVVRASGCSETEPVPPQRVWRPRYRAVPSQCRRLARALFSNSAPG